MNIVDLIALVGIIIFILTILAALKMSSRNNNDDEWVKDYLKRKDKENNE